MKVVWTGNVIRLEDTQTQQFLYPVVHCVSSAFTDSNPEHQGLYGRVENSSEEKKYHSFVSFFFFLFEIGKEVMAMILNVAENKQPFLVISLDYSFWAWVRVKTRHWFTFWYPVAFLTEAHRHSACLRGAE